MSKRCTSLAQTTVIRFLCDLISGSLTFVVHFSAYFVCSVIPKLHIELLKVVKQLLLRERFRT